MQLKTLEMAGNKLTGTLPLDWLSTPTLREFDVSFNSFSGVIPPPLAATDLYGSDGGALLPPTKHHAAHRLTQCCMQAWT